jgi:hypothetical protein
MVHAQILVNMAEDFWIQTNTQENNLHINKYVSSNRFNFRHKMTCRIHASRKNWTKLVLDWKHLQENLLA